MMRIFKQSYSDKYKLSYSDTYNQSYSDLFRVSIDPRVKPEGDRKESVLEGDERGRKPQYDNFKKSSLRAGTRGQAIFELVLWIFILSSSMVKISRAECTPTPDCVSIGYTATSCDSKFVRCPFDTSKLFCVPCDNDYKYTCDADGEVPKGNVCSGKYASCECADSEYIFTNGHCECKNITPTDCLIGAIYYASGVCSNAYVSCHNPVGVVVKDNELIASIHPVEMWWSIDRANISGLADISDYTVARSDYSGFSNTAAIVCHYGGNTNVSSNAGVYCYTYAPWGWENTRTKSYLPSLGEVWDYIYSNANTIKNICAMTGSVIVNNYIVSSTENGAESVWNIGIHVGSGGFYYKDSPHTVICLLAIK